MFETQVNFSVVPLENSTNGYVRKTIELLLSYSTGQLLQICGETTVTVRHCLAGWRKEMRRDVSAASTDPSNKQFTVSEPANWDFSHITDLHTHPQAWSQCTPFLDRYFSDTPRYDEDSTSRAAEIAAANVNGTSAAICSKLAAELFCLDLLAEDIHSDKDNMTRFLVVRQRKSTSTTVEEKFTQGTYNMLLIKHHQGSYEEVKAAECPKVKLSHWNLENCTGWWSTEFFSDLDLIEVSKAEQHNSATLKNTPDHVYNWGRWRSDDIPEP